MHLFHTDFRFTDTVLQWFSSYLTDRIQCVSLYNHCSAFAPVHSGVHQGTVLGTVPFSMYIKPLSTITNSPYITHNSYPDDVQLQMSALPDKIFELLHSMQTCIGDVKAWATANMLNLMTTRQNSCLSPQREQNISIPFLLQSLSTLLCEEIGFYFRLSSYCERTCLQYCSDMLL